MTDQEKLAKLREWREDWNKFAYEVLKADLDKEQQAILTSVQNNPMTAVASGTARGKDFVAAVAALCFLYLTPRFKNGELVSNTKVAMTAPTGRQVNQIMLAEVSRLFNNAKRLSGRLVSSGIKTRYPEWFLTGFKSEDNNTEVWSGFHAVNTMFVVTEASGISETIFNAIEGNLQGNSRLLIVFNPNSPTGYAAKAMRSERFASFRLNSLHAENVVQKRVVIPGQVDYQWVNDKVQTWAEPITEDRFNPIEGDFEWEGSYYRPNDLFRTKVLGLFPKISDDVLIPLPWVEEANKRWLEHKKNEFKSLAPLRIGVDVAGMGRDSSVLCLRRGDYVENFLVHQSKGQADHMHISGMVEPFLKDKSSRAFIDTIGEGAGVLSRLLELRHTNAISCKFSQSASGLTDETEQFTFANMKAYLYWCVRDWLNPKNGYSPALPPNEKLIEEMSETKWRFRSDGSIILEAKEKLQKRIGRSPDYLDALANSFYPMYEETISDEQLLNDFL